MEMISLVDGPTLPLEALLVAVDLEFRGFAFRVEGDALRLVSDSETVRVSLTENDRSAIKRWKAHLLVVVAYCEERTKRDSSSETVHRETRKRDRPRPAGIAGAT